MSIRAIAVAVAVAATVGFGSAAEASADPISPECRAAFEEGSLAGHQCESALREKGSAQSSQSSSPSQTQADQIAELTGMVWKATEGYNAICDLVACKAIPRDVSKSIKAVSRVSTLADLSRAANQMAVVAGDLDEISKATQGHVKGAPLSVNARQVARKTWNDTRALHRTLVGLVPGLAQLFPVPPPM